MKDLFSRPLVFQNAKARLEPLSIEHLDLLVPIALDPALWQFTSARVSSRADLEDYINIALDEKQKGLAYPFLVIDPVTRQVAGSTRYGNISADNKRLEIGWTWYAPQFQRTGLNRGCKFELLRFAFESLGWNRVEFKTSLLNTRSQTAIGKIGAKQEGVLRSHMINADGTIRDTVYFSIIREEWPEVRTKVFKEFL